MRCFRHVSVINGKIVVLGRYVGEFIVYEEGDAWHIEEVNDVKYIRVEDVLPGKKCVTKKDLPEVARRVLGDGTAWVG